MVGEMGPDTSKGRVKPIPGISTYNNFAFSPAGIRAWKAYLVGEGV